MTRIQRRRIRYRRIAHLWAWAGFGERQFMLHHGWRVLVNRRIGEETP